MNTASTILETLCKCKNTARQRWAQCRNSFFNNLMIHTKQISSNPMKMLIILDSKRCC
ncbi:hypothetical protein Hanom_Chr09g00839391 [Helianthus anomalus]